MLDATAQLLADEGYSSVTIEKIAATSGVARSTIYRHWDALDEIVLDAIQSMLGPVAKPPDKGNVRDDLIALYRQLARALARSEWGTTVKVIVGAALAEEMFGRVLAQAIDERRAGGRTVISRSIERGELPSGTKVDWLLDSVTGVLYYRALMSGHSLNERGMIEHLVESALTAAGWSSRPQQ